MALADAVQNSYHRAQQITWSDQDGNPIDLTGADLHGIMEHRGIQTNITGTLQIVNAPQGIFNWIYSAADVANAGTFFVEFFAHYANSGKPEISPRHKWFVSPAFGFALVSPSQSPSASLSPSASASA